MKKFRCIYDGDSFIGGIYCETMEEAQELAMSILSEWASSPFGSDEDHDMVVANCMTWVEEYDEDNDEWNDVWYPSDEFCESIGWVEEEV